MSAFLPIHEIIRTRRTIGGFQPVAVDPEIVTRALELACWAPNHRKTEPWRFTKIGPETQRRIIDLNATLVAAKSGADAAEAKRRQWSSIPGWLVVTCLLADDPFLREEDYAASCCAVQNLLLSLWSEGIGSKWSTGEVTRHAEFYRLLGVDPLRERSVGLIWYGVPQAIPQQSRQPLENVLRTLP